MQHDSRFYWYLRHLNYRFSNYWRQLGAPLGRIGRKRLSTKGRNQSEFEVDCNSLPQYVDILFVGHEETRTGAPKVFLDLIRYLQPLYETAVVSIKSGPLASDFESVCRNLLRLPEGLDIEGQEAAALKVISRCKPKLVYVNTVAAAPFALVGRKCRARTIMHVHEMFRTIKSVLPREYVFHLHNMADWYIAVSQEVDRDLRRLGCRSECIALIPEFIDITSVRQKASEEDAPNFCEALRTNCGERVVVACGSFGFRKGADIFLAIERLINNETGDHHFVWIGSYDQAFRHSLTEEYQSNPERVHFVGEVENPYPTIKAADMLLLPSREDPCPLVAIEALALRTPVVTSRISGGARVIAEQYGAVTDTLEPAEMAEAVLAVDSKRLGEGRQGELLSDYCHKQVLSDIHTIVSRAIVMPDRTGGQRDVKFTVVLPNYNYAWCVADAIESVLNQEYDNWELLIVDDYSNDRSLEVIEAYQKRARGRVRLISKRNHSKGLAQSLKLAAEEASGEYVAFLEADDIWRPAKLRETAAAIRDVPGLVAVWNDVELFGADSIYFRARRRQIGSMDGPARMFPSVPFYAHRYIAEHNFVFTLSALTVRKAALQKVDFENFYGPWFDWYLIAQLAMKGLFLNIPTQLTRWRIHEGSYNAEHLKSVDLLRETALMRRTIRILMAADASL